MISTPRPPRLTAEDLISIGVTSVGHRRKLLDAIAQLSATDASPAPIPPGAPAGGGPLVQHQDSALYPFITQLERAAGFAREDTVGAKLGKLRALLAPGTTAADLKEAKALLDRLA